MWHDEDLDDFIKTEHNWFYKQYKNYKHNINRFDEFDISYYIHMVDYMLIWIIIVVKKIIEIFNKNNNPALAYNPPYVYNMKYRAASKRLILCL